MNTCWMRSRARRYNTIIVSHKRSLTIDQYIEGGYRLLLAGPGRACFTPPYTSASSGSATRRRTSTITADDGRTVTAANFGGKLLVLNFWATWCPPCIAESPSLEQFAKGDGQPGVVVLGVSVDKDEKAYQRVPCPRPTFPSLTARDPEAKISARLRHLQSIPRPTSSTRNGKVVQKIIGKTNWTDGRDAQLT